MRLMICLAIVQLFRVIHVKPFDARPVLHKVEAFERHITLLYLIQIASLRSIESGMRSKRR
jgi:hypothetical protein